MSTIAIQDLRPLGSDLFMDHESYLRDMSSDELTIQGGRSSIPPTYTVVTGPVSVSISLTIGITALTFAISAM